MENYGIGDHKLALMSSFIEVKGLWFDNPDGSELMVKLAEVGSLQKSFDRVSLDNSFDVFEDMTSRELEDDS